MKNTVRVTFDCGNTITTGINGTKQEVTDYYLKNKFNVRCYPNNKLSTAVKVEFL